MAQSRRPLEFGDCDEEMTNDHSTPCEDVLRNTLMNQIGGLSARKVSGLHAADYKLSHKHFQASDQLKRMRNSVNPEHGTYGRPMGIARSTVPPAAALRWTWPTLARHARRGQRGTLDFTHGSTLARSAESLSALSDLSSPFSTGSVLECCCNCSRNSPRTYATAANSI